MKYILSISLLLSVIVGYPQNEGNIWYFGSNAGIDFNSGSPVALTDGALNTYEGSSSISDTTGTLLFYTDGLSIWNKNHNIMPNGFGLMGSVSSTQSAIIVKKPGSNSIYYVFTVDALGGASGFRYSEVDMSLQGGLGDVTFNKNVPIVTPVCEKITVIKHQNDIDYWVIIHIYGNNNFQSYLLSSTGLNMTPVISPVGSVPFVSSGVTAMGSLKGTLDGSRIAAAHHTLNIVELFDFNNSTGVLSNPMTFGNSSLQAPYGVEFSPDGNILYISEVSGIGNNIFQYNLLAGSTLDIFNSRITIGSTIMPAGALQLGPDHKIYLSKTQLTLDVINYPNFLGTACDFDIDGFSLAGQQGRLGLPNFNNSIFSKPTFLITNLCSGDSTNFIIPQTSIDSVFWNFGDSSSGGNNVSTNLNPLHLFTDTGIFVVTLITYFNGFPDTCVNSVYIYPNPNINLGIDSTLCQGEILTLNASTPDALYLWQDNSSDSIFTISQQGVYWVQVTAYNCITSDTLIINYDSIPIVNLGNDTALCQGEIILDASTLNSSYLWQDNSTNPTLNVLTSGTYWVIITVNNCSSSDTININYIPLPVVNLGNDSNMCEGDSLILNVTTNANSYLWQDNSSDSILTVSQQGVYWVQVTNICGIISDSININYSLLPTVTIDSFNPDTLCNNATPVVLPNASPLGGTYFGSNGIGSGVFDPVIAGIGIHDVIYTFTDSNSCVNNDTTNIVIILCVGIDEQIQSTLSIYPNPTSSQFIIEGLDKPYNLTIYNSLGQLLYTEVDVLDAYNKVDVSKFSKGLLFIRIESDGVMYHHKLIKK